MTAGPTAADARPRAAAGVAFWARVASFVALIVGAVDALVRLWPWGAAAFAASVGGDCRKGGGTPHRAALLCGVGAPL